MPSHEQRGGPSDEPTVSTDVCQPGRARPSRLVRVPAAGLGVAGELSPLLLLCQLSQALLRLRLTSIGLSECDLLLRLSENAIQNDEGLCRILICRKLYRLPEPPKLIINHAQRTWY